MSRLLAELSPSDPLSCLVALQLLQELVLHLGDAAADILQQLLLPALVGLLDEPDTAAGALPIAAQLVAAAAPHAAAACCGNGNGLASPAGAVALLLAKMAGVLDDRCVQCGRGCGCSSA